MKPNTEPRALSHAQIEQTLDEYLEPVLSTRRTAEQPVQGVCGLSPAQQRFALHWTDVIRRSNAEMAYQFVSQVPAALNRMGVAGCRAWLLQAMDVYDKEGLYPGSAVLNNWEAFAQEFGRSDSTVRLEQVHAVLETFIAGLAGRPLKIAHGDSVYTDTDTLFLPPQVNRFAQREENYRLYKARAVHLWAQTWFGTFRRATPESPHLLQLLAEFADNGRALRLFNLLETIRLNACIERELPGLARELLTLDPPAPLHDRTWQKFAQPLKHPTASVADTLAATAALYPLSVAWPAALVYQVGFDLSAAAQRIDQRLAAEKIALQNSLQEVLDAKAAESPEALPQGHFEADSPAATDPTHPGHPAPELKLDGQPLAPPPALQQQLQSMRQDLDNLPEEWLVAAGDGGYRDAAASEKNRAAEPDDRDFDAYRYNEWDYRRQTYRKNWCVLRELDSHPLFDDFPATTLAKYRHLVGHIRRHFEALRGEDKTLKAQASGDNVDLDALLTAYADMHSGVEMNARVFTQKHKVSRDLAVVFMVDVSGSTKGWINTAERESLLLLCEALEVLRDQYAIYGFSGMTRNRCEVYTIKTFAQAYDRTTRARISGLRPQDYTRMGVTIRHLSQKLTQVEAKTRILITLSDGKPDDYDGYRGDYGIADTRQALLEARHHGIHPFCITIDKHASDYLPYMYGAASYVVVDDVKKLPLKVAEIYRRLTG